MQKTVLLLLVSSRSTPRTCSSGSVALSLGNSLCLRSARVTGWMQDM